MSGSSPTESSASLSPIGEPADPDPPGVIGSDASHHHHHHHSQQLHYPRRTYEAHLYQEQQQQGGIAHEPGHPVKKLFFTSEMRDRQARGKEPYAMPATAVGLVQQREMLEEHLHEKEEKRRQQKEREGRRIRTEAAAAAAGESTAESTAQAGSLSGGSGGGGSPAHADSSMRVDVDNALIFGQANYLWNPNQHHSNRRPVNAAICPMDQFELLDRRRHAALVLDTPELLMMYAQTTGDSIPATRWRFTQILCGCDEKDAVTTLLYGPPAEQRLSGEAAARTYSAAAVGGSSKAAVSGSGKRKLPHSWGS